MIRLPRLYRGRDYGNAVAKQAKTFEEARALAPMRWFVASPTRTASGWPITEHLPLAVFLKRWLRHPIKAWRRLRA